MDIWSWICELPDQSDESSNSQQILPLASPKNENSETQSIEFRAERIRGLDSEVFFTFSICFVGFPCFEEKEKIIWASDTFPLDSGKPFLPLVLQLLQEIVSRSPTAHDSTRRTSQLEKPDPQPVSWILDSYSPNSFSSFFTLIFLMHLFWLCAWDSPSEVGSFYFRSLLEPNIDEFTCKHAPILQNFFVAIGADVELCVMRTFGYILAKWLILREFEAGLRYLTHLPSKNLGFSYATEAHGLWVLKGYAPVKSMNCVQSYQGGQNSNFPSVIQATESLLKYALSHQQLEAVIQLEYTVGFHENYVQVNARVDNLRLHVVKLGFKKDKDDILLEEKYFPSRIRIWVGPETGAGYVGGLSLGRSTDYVEREMEVEKILKGSFGNSKSPRVKALEKKATRVKIKNWRWDQDVDGNVAIFDASLCDTTSGVEVAMWKPTIGGQMGADFKNRYTGGGRRFTKSGGLVVSGADCGGSVEWRMSKEMEGSVLKWGMGGKIWVTYLANNVRTSYYETRCIEWCDEVDLPIIPSKN